VAVIAVVEVAKEQLTEVPLTRQGEAIVKSVVRLMARVLELTAVEVRILTAN
jgi:hypothetical protein